MSMSIEQSKRWKIWIELAIDLKIYITDKGFDVSSDKFRKCVEYEETAWQEIQEHL